MLSLAALFVGSLTGVLGFHSNLAFAATQEIPVKGSEKILISVPDAMVTVQGTSGKTLKITLSEAAKDDDIVQIEGNLISIHPKEAMAKDQFGKVSAKKHVIEIQGPSLNLEVHSFDGQVQLNHWGKEALVHLQKGRLVSRDGSASLFAHSQFGEIAVVDHRGRVEIDSYRSAVSIRGLDGDAVVQNFSGETVVEKAKGFLSINQGQGSAKILGSSGSAQFELNKGVLNVQGFHGRVEGQTQEGPVNVTMVNESEINVRSQSGRVTVQAPQGSGALLNLSTQEGEIVAPAYLKVVRDGGQKSLRARLKGETAKGSIVIRAQEGSIIIR